MKNNVSYKIAVVALFILFITALFIVETYALFETNASGDAELDVGKWVILLNNEDVVETRTLTIDNFVYVNGSHTQSGYFAPGTSAYFDIEIDATDSDVSMEYLLDIDDSALDDHPNIYFTVTDLDNNTTTTTNSYNGLIRLSDVSKVDNVRINLVWNNQAAYDEDDTSLIDGELEFTITANFKQSIAE